MWTTTITIEHYFFSDLFVKFFFFLSISLTLYLKHKDLINFTLIVCFYGNVMHGILVAVIYISICEIVRLQFFVVNTLLLEFIGWCSF